MLDVARQLINGITDIANAVELPTRLIAILGIVTTALGYFIGRRRALVEQSAGRGNDALLAEMRQGFAAVTAALAALSSGPPAADPSTPATTASAPAPDAPLAPLVQPPLPPVAPLFSVVTAPATSASAPHGERRPWARRPALAICAAVALALTLAGVIGALSVRGDGGAFAAFSLLAVLGFALAAVTFIWASAAALRQGRWGWAVTLVFGTLALTFLTVFTLPTLLILVFAVWGPAPARGGGAARRARSGGTSPAFVPLAAAPVSPSTAPPVAAAFELPSSTAASPAAMLGGAIPLQPAPPSGRLMPPAFPGPAQMLYPVAVPSPGEEMRGE